MKTPLILLFVLVYGAGCATQSLSCPETCSLQNMKCEGISMGTGSGSAYDYRTGSYSDVRTSYGGVNCSVARTKEDTDEVRANRKPAEEKWNYNENARTGTILGEIGGLILAALIAVSAAQSKSGQP